MSAALAITSVRQPSNAAEFDVRLVGPNGRNVAKSNIGMRPKSRSVDWRL
jgi:hypothetical protein